MSFQHFTLAYSTIIFCFIILINVNAHFIEKPRNQSVQLGEDVPMIRCAVDSEPLMKQWRSSDGMLLGPQGSGQLSWQGRYRYISESPNELGLSITNVTLSDDGQFECQMIVNGEKLRASAYITVLVPPKNLFFQYFGLSEASEIEEVSDTESYSNSIVAQADQPLNISCITPVSKPESQIQMFLSGKKVHDVHTDVRKNPNSTVATIVSTLFTPSSKDNGKMLVCEAIHEASDNKIREHITLNIQYLSEPPKIEVVGPNYGQKWFNQGENITLLCVAEGGNPPPTLHWSKDDISNTTGSVFDENTRFTTNIISFTAKGENNGNNVECSCLSPTYKNPTLLKLKASFPLEIHYQPETTYIFGKPTTRKNEDFMISCITDKSNPASTITWEVNGIQQPSHSYTYSEEKSVQGIVSSSNITLNTGKMLNGQDLNQISIKCIAENNEGPPASSLHIVRVLSPPSYPFIHESNQLKQLDFLEDQIMNLTCEAQGGNPLAQLQWYRGVEKLTNIYNSNYEGSSTRSILSIKVDRTMNGIRFRCEAESPAIDVPLNVEIIVSVRFPPNVIEITQIDREYEDGMMADRPAKLHCSVGSANPMPDVHWQFISMNGKIDEREGEYRKRPLKPNSEFNGYRVENIIEFKPNETMDGSVARCIASNSRWIKNTHFENYTLSVFHKPRFSINDIMTLEVKEGNSFKEGIVVSANPLIEDFHWRKNGVKFERSIGSIFVGGPNPLIIGGTDVQKEDAGIYILRVANRVGFSEISIRISIRYSARVTYITPLVIASVGEDVVLECEADGNPIKPDMIKWMFNGSEITGPNILPGQRRVVLRLNASQESSGPYECSANNGLGEVNSSTTFVLVKHHPILQKLPSLLRAAGPIGGKAFLRCRFKAIPEPEMTWTIDGTGQTLSQNTTKYTLTKEQIDLTTFQSTLGMFLEDRDYGRRFRCRATNELGTQINYITVEQPTLPDTPLNFQIANLTDESVALSWTAGFDGGYDGQLFEIVYSGIEGKIDSRNTTNTIMVIDNLQSEQRYEVKIRSTNRRFASEFSKPIWFSTLDKDLRPSSKMSQSESARFITQPIFLWVCGALILLFVFNCIVIACLRHQNRRNKRTGMKCSLNPNKIGMNSNGLKNNVNNRGNIQIYGTMNTNGVRLNSDMTNKTDDAFENSEDNEDIQTVVEVSPPYVHAVNHHPIDGYYNPIDGYYHNSTRPVTDFDNADIYARIQKLPYQDTYFAHQHPLPPNADAGICYQDMGYDDMNMMDQHELIAMNSSEPPLHAENHYAHNQQYYYVHDSNVVGDGTDCFANNFAYETTGEYGLPVAGNEMIDGRRNLSTFQQPQQQMSINPLCNEAIV